MAESSTPKEGLAILIGKMKKSGSASKETSGQNPYPMQSRLKSLLEQSSEEQAEAEDDPAEGYAAAMQDFINAVHSKDVAAACEAFHDVQACCGGDSEGEDDEDYITNDDAHEGSLDIEA